MAIKAGLMTALNAMREVSVQNNGLYHQYVPVIDGNTDIGAFATPILKYKGVQNEFMEVLINRIVETKINRVNMKNPLRMLMGSKMPVGYAGQEIFVNPATPTEYNPNDLVGLLEKYEADVHVQYYELNSDIQFKVTVTRHELKKAFTSWEKLDSFIDGIVQSLYNGANITEFNFTKRLVSAAYQNYTTPIMQVEGVSTKEQADAFLTQAQSMYYAMQFPSSQYNGTAATTPTKPITTMTDPSKIVFLVRGDIMSYVNVNTLAAAFNIDKALLVGRVIPVDNFDVYDPQSGAKIFDGSSILGIIADETWFRIEESDFYLDMFYNANARTWSYFLNDTKSYSQNLFSNGVILATAMPTVTLKSMEFPMNSVNVEVGADQKVTLNPFPATATSTITFASSSNDIFTVDAVKGEGYSATITGVGKGTGVLIATAENGVTATLQVNVVEAPAAAAAASVQSETAKVTESTPKDNAKVTESTPQDNAKAEESNATNSCGIINIDSRYNTSI